MPETNTFVDKTITCRDCKTDFAWTAGEQEWYADPQRNFGPPVRCKTCREARRAERKKHRGVES
jgi:hypothetical protein